MKKIFILLLLSTVSIGLFAQMPAIASKIKTLPSLTETGNIVSFNANFADTLKSADTLVYKTLVVHSGIGYPYISQLTKLVANDTTATITFWQSVDGKTNWQQVLNTASPTAWSITVAKSTTTGSDISFWRSIAWFESQYLAMRIIANTKSGFKTIYYGSIRYNSNK